MPADIKRTKDFDKSLAALNKKGGHFSRAVNQIYAALGKAATDLNPFEGLRLTKHGERRIKNCTKYDLTGRCRLVTASYRNTIFLLFAGTHSDCEQWLDRNRNLTIKAGEDEQPLVIFVSTDISAADSRIEGEGKQYFSRLFDSISNKNLEALTKRLEKETKESLLELSSLDSDDEILAILDTVDNEQLKNAIFDVAMLLREGNIEQAERRILVYRNLLRDLENVIKENGRIPDSEDFSRISVDSDQYRKLIEHYSVTADFRDWMLFMHPDQESHVTESFPGPCKLTGVSGSGKTCVVAKRAIYLVSCHT